MSGNQNWAAEFAVQIKEFEALRSQRSRIEGEVAQVKRNLEDAQNRALELFGTSDPAQLEQIARDIDSANERVANEFIASVTKVKSALVAASGQRMG